MTSGNMKISFSGRIAELIASGTVVSSQISKSNVMNEQVSSFLDLIASLLVGDLSVCEGPSPDAGTVGTANQGGGVTKVLSTRLGPGSDDRSGIDDIGVDMTRLGLTF